ncbi:MAG: hypothetical protein ACYS0I_21595, partial [Planctomycetota bacterium]
VRFGSEVTETNSTVSTHYVGVYALYCRFFQYAIRGTVAAGNAYFGIDLPDGVPGVGLSAEGASGGAKTD